MRRFTPEQIAFLKSGWNVWRIPELTLFFNAWFETTKTQSQIRAAIKNRKFTCGRTGGHNKGVYRDFTQEQAEFIRVEYRNMSHDPLAILFNEKFGTSKTGQQIRSFVHNHGINSGRSGHFRKGDKPWNTGTKGVMKPNSGNFKPGTIPPNLRPLGSERLCSKDGHVLVKISEKNPYNGQATRWMAKHVVNWEAVNGKVPAGFILRFKDGDNLNSDPENMELITRSEHVRLNQLHYNDTPEDLKPTIRAIAKIQMKAGSLKPKQESGART